MNKSDLVDAVAARADMSKAEAGRAVDAVLGSVGDAPVSYTHLTLPTI
mgnify:CR=1 FL=1